MEESREAEAVAKAAIEKELEEERNNAAEIKREFEEKRKQLQKEKEATVRAVLTVFLSHLTVRINQLNKFWLLNHTVISYRSYRKNLM